MMKNAGKNFIKIKQRLVIRNMLLR